MHKIGQVLVKHPHEAVFEFSKGHCGLRTEYKTRTRTAAVGIHANGGAITRRQTTDVRRQNAYRLENYTVKSNRVRTLGTVNLFNY